MNYLKFGTSKNYIVFLHGWGADLNSFLWIKDYYKDYSLVFVDFAGFGKTAEPSKPYYVRDYATELFDLLSKFEIDSLVLVGHSFGGRVAIKFLFLFQNSFKCVKLVLVDSAGLKPRRSIGYYFKIALYKFCKKIFKGKKILDKFGSSDYKKLSSVMKQTFVNVVNEDLSCNAKILDCKILIVWGSRDLETKVYMAKKFHKLIKKSDLKILKGAGHFSFLDKKEDFMILFDEFIVS